MNKKLKVGLAFNVKPEESGKSNNVPDDQFAEWDSVETIEAVAEALRINPKGEKRREVVLFEANENFFGKICEEKPDIVFNLAEGIHGVSREAQVPAILDMLQVPYTGSDPVTLGVCLDKQRTKEILSFNNILTPKFSIVNSRKELKEIILPSVVKPVWEGSSKGVTNSSLVRTKKELLIQIDRIVNEYHQPALVEEFLEGREFTVGVLGNKDRLAVLPIVEVKLDTLPKNVNKIYSYEAKWIWDKPDDPLNIFDCPAKIEQGLKKEIESICYQAFNVFRCQDWCRIDVRLDKEGKPHILELNPLPGILPNPEENSCFPKAARAAGIDYESLINLVLNSAMNRYPALSEKYLLKGVEKRKEGEMDGFASYCSYL